MKKASAIFFTLVLIIGISSFYFFSQKKENVLSPIGKKILEKPLDKYTFETLKKTNFEESQITIGKKLKDGEGFESYIFYYTLKDEKSLPRQRRVSGMLNLPKKEGTFPVIVMYRGYVDREKYTIGEGTRHSSEVFAQNGFITLAPDFLGYGESDNPSSDSFEERFQTYTTAITLLNSVKNLNNGLLPISENIKADPEKIGIWGHSNGGQISLSVLEITGRRYPTVLWAPVSKPFPYSILYFTDESSDHGKILRKVLANFEKDYDVEKYSLTNYLSWINAPLQINQGTDDEEVPLRWSDQLNEELKKADKNVTYYTYSGENHNFNNGLWPLAIQRAISFYTFNLK